LQSLPVRSSELSLLLWVLLVLLVHLHLSSVYQQLSLLLGWPQHNHFGHSTNNQLSQHQTSDLTPTNQWVWLSTQKYNGPA